MIEQKEPHAGRMAFEAIAQPASFTERRELARRLRDELEVPMPIFVDGMDDASRALFSDLPSPAFLLDREGRIADKLPWADPEPLARAIERLLEVDRIPDSTGGAWTLDQRVAFARRLLAAGRPEAALGWLDARSDPEPCVPPALTTVAQAALTRAEALAGAPEAARTPAITAAQAAIADAWPKDPGRRLAAQVQLAEAAARMPLAATLWREASASLEARAPEVTRQWLEARIPLKPR